MAEMSSCFHVSRRHQLVFCGEVSPRALCHLKDSYLYLDFPLRGISLGHRGAVQPQRRERRSCSVADRRSVWWIQTRVTHPALTAGIPSLAQGNVNRFSHLVDKSVLSVLYGVCDALMQPLRRCYKMLTMQKKTPHSSSFSFILFYSPPSLVANSSVPISPVLCKVSSCCLVRTGYGFL